MFDFRGSRNRFETTKLTGEPSLIVTNRFYKMYHYSSLKASVTKIRGAFGK